MIHFPLPCLITGGYSTAKSHKIVLLEKTWWLIASTPNWMIMILHVAYFRQDCVDQGDCILTRSRTCHGYIIKCLVILQKCCLKLATHPMFIKHGPNMDRLVIVCRSCTGSCRRSCAWKIISSWWSTWPFSSQGGLPAMGPLRPLVSLGSGTAKKRGRILDMKKKQTCQN